MENFNKGLASLTTSLQGLSSQVTPLTRRTQRLIQETLGNADEKVFISCWTSKL